MAKKPRVILRCVANNYAMTEERIIEFYDDKVQAGGLIAFQRIEGNDGRYTLRVSVYQYDSDLVEVTGANELP